MTNEQGVCWIDGQLLKPAEARISVFDHGLLYGDGIFEGIRFYNGQPFMLAEHLIRLNDSARALAITIPYSDAQLGEAIKQVISTANSRDGYLRLVITRGVGSLGIDPASCQHPSTIIIASPLAMVSAQTRRQGLKLIIAGIRRMAVDVLDARIKSLNYLNNILARMQANTAGADEAVLLNAAGYIAEGSADNIFIVKNDCLYTPPVSEGALAGVTRHIVMQLAAASGITVKEERLAPYDLYTADECFLTGTGAELLPVREIDGRTMQACPGAMFNLLEQAFQQFIKDETISA